VSECARARARVCVREKTKISTRIILLLYILLCSVGTHALALRQSFLLSERLNESADFEPNSIRNSVSSIDSRFLEFARTVLATDIHGTASAILRWRRITTSPVSISSQYPGKM